MNEQFMFCASCNAKKHWRDGFPSRIYAVCWQCSWDQHMDEKHPLSWAERRRIRQVARRLTRTTLAAEARAASALAALPEPIGALRYSGFSSVGSSTEARKDSSDDE